MAIVTTVRWMVAFSAGLLGPLLLVNRALARQDLPDYATWVQGPSPRESGSCTARGFAEGGPVGVAALGSSIADFGFQADAAQMMSVASGRPYRAFNFAAGAAEISTLPLLHRLLRTVARPRMPPARDPSQGKGPRACGG